MASSKPTQTLGTRSGARRQLVTQELVDRAAELFAEKGYRGTTLQDIADALGMSRPGLYRYVSSKEDVLAALVAGVTENTAATLADIREHSSLGPLDRLEEAVRRLASGIARNPLSFRVLVLSEPDLPPAIAPRHRRARREVLRHLEALVRDAAEAGALRPVDERVVSFSILGMSNWIAWWYQPGGELSPEQVADEMARLVLDGVRRDDVSGPTPREIAANLRRQADLLDRLG
jgi:AcrR family transcriptional regulator